MAPNSDNVLRACCGKVYDTLFAMNLKPAREDLVRDDDAIQELTETIKSIWVEEWGGDPASWPWNRSYVLKTFIRYRKETRQMKDTLQKPKTLLPNEIGYVYFIRNSRNHVKIGWSEYHPSRRLKELQTGESDDLKLEGFISGSEAKEKSLHYNFSQYRIRKNGEWFYSNPDLEQLIKDSKQCQ